MTEIHKIIFFAIMFCFEVILIFGVYRVIIAKTYLEKSTAQKIMFNWFIPMIIGFTALFVSVFSFDSSRKTSSDIETMKRSLCNIELQMTGISSCESEIEE